LLSSCSSQSPCEFNEKHLSAGQEHVPSSELQTPPFRQSLRPSQSVPVEHASMQMQSPLAEQTPFPLPSHGLASKVLHVGSCPPNQHALQAHVTVSQSQSPWPLHCKRFDFVGQL
jgi:hypothetical protein